MLCPLFCVACEAWKFGTNCTKMCNCLEKPCNTFTGECQDSSCKAGWKGDSCNQGKNNLMLSMKIFVTLTPDCQPHLYQSCTYIHNLSER